MQQCAGARRAAHPPWAGRRWRGRRRLPRPTRARLRPVLQRRLTAASRRRSRLVLREQGIEVNRDVWQCRKQHPATTLPCLAVRSIGLKAPGGDGALDRLDAPDFDIAPNLILLQLRFEVIRARGWRPDLGHERHRLVVDLQPLARLAQLTAYKLDRNDTDVRDVETSRGNAKAT